MKRITMKQISSVLLILALMLSLCMCAQAPAEPTTTQTTITLETSQVTTEQTTLETQEETTQATTETQPTQSTQPQATTPTQPKQEQPPETTQATTQVTVPETTQQETSSGSSFQIQFIDVGQADAALVSCDGHYMLIDGGNKADSNVIYAILKRNNITHLDVVVGTHAHEDHIGGLPGAYQYATADKTLCPVTSYSSKAFQNFASAAKEKGGGITIPRVGDTFYLGSARVEILGVNEDSDPNNTSIVLRIDYGQTSFLFTGDAEREAEQKMLNRGANLSATVLKVGHHGSNSSTTYPFLREVMPAYAVISVGTGNTYGHPTENTLSRLRDADVQVFRTDRQGDVFCSSDGRNVTFWTN